MSKLIADNDDNVSTASSSKCSTSSRSRPKQLVAKGGEMSFIEKVKSGDVYSIVIVLVVLLLLVLGVLSYTGKIDLSEMLSGVFPK
jgi:hypothetical protein